MVGWWKRWKLAIDVGLLRSDHFQEGSRNSSWSRRVVTAGFGFVLSNWGILQEPQRHYSPCSNGHILVLSSSFWYPPWLISPLLLRAKIKSWHTHQASLPSPDVAPEVKPNRLPGLTTRFTRGPSILPAAFVREAAHHQPSTLLLVAAVESHGSGQHPT